MSPFSIHLPRFLHFPRSRRSDLPRPSPAGACDDHDPSASNPPRSGSTLALSFRAPSTQGAPGQTVNPAISTSSSPVPSAQTHPPSSAGRRPVVGAVENAMGQPSVPEGQDPSDNELPPSQHRNQGFFYRARNLFATGNFIDRPVCSVTNYFNTSTNFMEKLLKETIPGAAADSSARDPPPRCHPGTRLAILERCLYFIVHCIMEKKMRWVVGAAGVGKSAIMQSVANSRQLVVAYSASCFFSISGRSDATKAIITLSYQLAAKSDLYRRVIEDQVGRDPRLLQSSMAVQFEKFIVQPFIHNTDLNSAGRVLVIIDGLDECKNTRTQVELLRIIADFCTSYPSSPIAWLIASRPEPHITSFFSRPEVIPVYEKEEIVVDSNEARADVEQFLRHELMEIGRESDFLGSQWHDERDLWKLASAAGGLFAYAHTAIRYIGDSTVGDPVSQLSEVLNVIDEHPMSDLPPEQHPMALLDALYAQILSKIPSKVMENVRKLLLLLASDWHSTLPFSKGHNLIVMCNWLGMSADEAYAALNRLRSVLDFPLRNEAHNKTPKPFHKSLIDYLSRSASFPNVQLLAQQIKSRCAFRVLNEAPDGIDFGDVNYQCSYGKLARNRGIGSKITITWRTDAGIDWDNDETRLSMYKLAIGEVAAGVGRGDPEFQSEFCIKLLTTRLEFCTNDFPFKALSDFVFEQSRRHEFMKCGILRQIPAGAISDYVLLPNLYHIRLQFHGPVGTTTLPDPWNSSCMHERVGQWEQGKEQHWTTTVVQSDCAFCYDRFIRQLEDCFTRHPDRTLLFLCATDASCRIEYQFVDPEDNVSEWTYRFSFYNLPVVTRLRRAL